ncbi:hypothetical protein [Sphingobacterium hungaricum]
MKLHNFLQILFALLISQASFAQSSANSNIQTDLKDWFSAGTVLANVAEYTPTNRQLELTEKIKTALNDNLDWYYSYIKDVPPGEPMPYHENIGLSLEEYTEFLELGASKNTFSSLSENLEIVLSDGIIRFDSQINMEILDSIQIDLNKNIVSLGKIRMPFKQTVDVSSEDNFFNSKWSGYSWGLEEPDGLEAMGLEDLLSAHIKSYNISIGKIEKTGQILINLNFKEINQGEKLMDISLPIFFDKR